MVELHENVEHINTISRLSPYLFFRLLLLIWNIVFTILGVHLNDNNSLDYTIVKVKEGLYYASLVGFFTVCLTLSFIKCGFICCITRKKARSHQWRKVVETLLYNIIFIIMGTLYLAGDNLTILMCSGMDNTVDKDNCIENSSIILGVSLLLNTALYVAGTFNLKPTAATLPVTGRIRKAYQSILQLAALTILLDQNFSTVVRLMTHIDHDIELDESPNCGCPGNTTTCSSLWEVVGFFAGLSTIMVLIVVGLTVKGWKDYCSCCWKKWWRQCCCHFLENILIFSFMYIFVFVFMGIYTLTDNSWLWKCTPVSQNNPKYIRIGLLYISLLLSFIWIAMYMVIIGVPGVGIVWKKKRYLDENEYISVQAEIEKSEWVCKYARVKRKINANGNDGDDANGNDGIQMRTLAKYGSINDSDATSNQADNSNSIQMTVEENYGSVSITLPIEEHITWRQGCCYCWRKCRKKGSSTCTGKTKTASTEHLVSSIEQDTTCTSYLQDTSWWKCLMKQRCKEYDMAEADEEMIMFTYLGKRKYVRNATVSNGSVNLCDDENTPFCGTQSYILIPTKLVASESGGPEVAHNETDERTADASESGGPEVAHNETDERTADASESGGPEVAHNETDERTADASERGGPEVVQVEIHPARPAVVPDSEETPL